MRWNDYGEIEMRYRRADVDGGTYFFTVNLAERKRTLLIDEIDKLKSTIAKVKKDHPFEIDACVVMPSFACCLDIAERRSRFRNSLDVN